MALRCVAVNQKYQVSPARLERRRQLKLAVQGLIGSTATRNFDLYHAPLCALDILMVAGAPWLKLGLEKDFSRDKSGYRKIGGRGNSPKAPYFYRSTANLIHYLKRQGFYLPRGSDEPAAEGMACFFDCDDRGRFNFTPDRSGIITEVTRGFITRVVLARKLALPDGGFEVSELQVEPGSELDRALIGYCDLP